MTDDKDSISVELPLKDAQKLGSFHVGVCFAEVEGAKVEVSVGYGCGHTDMYVAVDGKRYVVVDTSPLLSAVIDLAIDKWKKAALS